MATGIPIWFGTDERPLFGWFHGPENGRARSGVVICPSFGLEYIQAHYAVRLLAEELSEKGMCVLRFDYDGMGDSAGSVRDPHRLESWTSSITQAIQVVRQTGLGSVSLVGMRIGATLAAHVAAAQGGVDRIVLWDPCISGRSFLREGAAAFAFGLGLDPTDDTGSAELPGLSLDAETVAELNGVSLTKLPRPPAEKHPGPRPKRAHRPVGRPRCSGERIGRMRGGQRAIRIDGQRFSGPSAPHGRP